MAYTVKAVFGSESIVKTDTIYQYNSGQVLQIEGLAFTNSTEFHLAIHGKDTAYVMTGTIENNTAKITIPEVLMINDFCTCNYRIDVFVYVIDNSSGYTKYKIIIPVKSRPRPEGYYVDLPTVPELKSLKQELNTAVDNFNDAYTEIDQLKSETASLKEDLGEYVFSKTKNVNLLDIDDSDVQYGFYNSTNGKHTANDAALTSGFILYESDSVYRFTFPTDWFKYSVTLWDENKSIVLADLSSFISKENGYATFSSTTYSNAKYVRFTILDQSKDFSTAMVVKDVEYPSTYIPYGYTVKYSKKLDREIENIAKNINPVTIFDNKVMLFTGDSICYGANWRPTVEDYSNTGWRKIIQENYPKSITYGYGIGGTTISKRSGRTDSILERMTTMFSEHPEADYIIIQGGVNDAYNITDCPIGTISTGYTAELNENTFAGALESIFKYAQTNWIGKKIGYIVTFKVPSAMGQFKFNEYMDIAKQICEKWSVPYCDLYNESNLNYYIQEVSNVYGGGLHPNEAGYRIITNKIEKWLETL